MNKLFRSIVIVPLILGLAACGGGGVGSSGSLSTNSGSSAVTALQVTDNVVGTGAAAADGDTLAVNFTGWLYNGYAANFEGTEFQTTAGTPFSFVLGQGKVIAGWDQGLVGMKVGGTRTLIVPSSLAYGATGNATIPPNAALVFTVELVSVTPPQS
ncbi:MAG: FKBP-type peptidyl-prolyl cis-trans isomerase [Burkholderiaceae bacterium]|nr:FKBP-type peptidyl-prolyl cis-trans isomerase [Burkholderiaceae bacterium]